MESAFTGLVRKHRVPFKLNRSITSHNTIITVLLIFRQVLLFFFGRFSLSSLLHSLCVSYTHCPCSSVGACACQCHGHERMTEQGVINEN